MYRPLSDLFKICSRDEWKLQIYIRTCVQVIYTNIRDMFDKELDMYVRHPFEDHVRGYQSCIVIERHSTVRIFRMIYAYLLLYLRVAE